MVVYSLDVELCLLYLHLYVYLYSVCVLFCHHPCAHIIRHKPLSSAFDITGKFESRTTHCGHFSIRSLPAAARRPAPKPAVSKGSPGGLIFHGCHDSLNGKNACYKSADFFEFSPRTERKICHGWSNRVGGGSFPAAKLS